MLLPCGMGLDQCQTAPGAFKLPSQQARPAQKQRPNLNSIGPYIPNLAPVIKSRAVASFWGRESRNTQPFPELLFNSRAAPICAASCLLMARPRPLPPGFVEWQGVNNLACNSAGKPGPSSATSHTILFSTRDTSNRTDFPSGVA